VDQSQRDGTRGDRRELYNGFSDTFVRAVELVATPLILGFMGYGLDRWLGTVPLFTLILGLFCLGYLVWKTMRQYDRDMTRQQVGAPWARGPEGTRHG
jgi:F0F1-type ATP synthase assembly protein I